VVGGAAIGLIIAAVLDMILDVARVHGRDRPRPNAAARADGPPEAGPAGHGQ